MSALRITFRHNAVLFGPLAFAISILGLTGCQEGGVEPINSESDAATIPDNQDGGASDTAIEARGADDAASESETSSPLADGSTEVDVDSAGVDAVADITVDASPDAAGDSGVDAAPYPPVCGDGHRDPDTEECDDGLDPSVAEESRSCTDTCTVTDQVIGLQPATERRLGLGRHPVAAGALGSAAAFVEVLASGEPRVAVATFSLVGERIATASTTSALYDADPVLAALPDGSFALAFNSLDVDGDGLGVALAVIEPDGSVGAIKHANETLSFGQHSPDILWLGSELIVGWEDESIAGNRRLCTRRFSASLTALSSESCASGNGWYRSHLVLGQLGGMLVKAWREEQGGASHAVLSGLGPTQNLDLGGLPASWEAPAVAAIDTDHVLLVHTSADDSLLGLVVDSSGNAVSGPAPLFYPPVAPRYSPSLVVTGDGIYLAWQEPPPPPDPVLGWDPKYEETWIQKLLWDGQTLDTEELPVPLPRHSWHQPGDQTMPALAATPLGPLGGIFAAWNDLTSDNYPVEAPHGDVAFSLIPTPILRQPMGH